MATEGIEPPSSVCKADVLPLNEAAKPSIAGSGIEPLLQAYETRQASTPCHPPVVLVLHALRFNVPISDGAPGDRTRFFRSSAGRNDHTCSSPVFLHSLTTRKTKLALPAGVAPAYFTSTGWRLHSSTSEALNDPLIEKPRQESHLRRPLCRRMPRFSATRPYISFHDRGAQVSRPDRHVFVLLRS